MTSYKNDFLTYTVNGSVRSDCADITFFNAGGTDLIINNAFTLLSGQYLSFQANNNEIDRTIYNFYFVGTGTGVLNVIRKVYI